MRVLRVSSLKAAAATASIAAAAAALTVGTSDRTAEGDAAPPAAVVQPPQLVRPKLHASFARSRNLEELNGLSTVVVVARVTAVADGPRWISDDPRASGEPTALPTRDVTLAVESRLRGRIGAEPVWSFVLPPGGLEVEGNETPRVGERYLLFLREHPRMAGRWIVPLIDGRVSVGAGGRSTFALANGVGQRLAREFNDGGVAGLREDVR